MLKICAIFFKKTKRVWCVFLYCFMISVISPTILADATKGYDFLYETMDKYHTQFSVYTDHDRGGNHFYPTGWMGDVASCEIDTLHSDNCYSGTTCLKISYNAVGLNWVAAYWQQPENNWGTIPNAGYDLTGATEISFWARGENGGEQINFFAGGISGSYSDSFPKTSTDWIILTTDWQRYSIDLTGKNLTYVIGGFGFETNAGMNPQGAVFYLDDIQYNKSSLEQPRFLVSYETITTDNPDSYLKNVSFIYDDALALLAFLARGESEDINRARILADAFVYVQQNDRYYQDGRLRNAYMSGDLADRITGFSRLPGRWDPVLEQWLEDESFVSTHTGNLAWVMIALLSYYQQEGGSQYLNSAIDLGDWIITHTKDPNGIGGFTGGYQGWEPAPYKIPWKATEHSIDIYAAFMLLYEITGDVKWKDNALHAKSFVESMWNPVDSHFWTGTTADGQTISQGNVPLDIQAWAIMSLGLKYVPIVWAEQNCYVESDGFKGFDFNFDKDGVWFEGTAQMIVAYQILEDMQKSNMYITELRKAQTDAANANGKGIVAASHDGVTTGFDWEYFSRNHIGATAWYLYAENEYNPYWNTPCIKTDSQYDFNKNNIVDLPDLTFLTSNWLWEDVIPFGRCDLTADGKVDLLDLSEFSRKWMKVVP